MSFQYRQLQIQTFECSVCKQYYNEDHLADTAQQAKLFGAKPYAVCPCCLQSVDRKLIRNRGYRTRARLWIAKREEHK